MPMLNVEAAWKSAGSPSQQQSSRDGRESSDLATSALRLLPVEDCNDLTRAIAAVKKAVKEKEFTKAILVSARHSGIWY